MYGAVSITWANLLAIIAQFHLKAKLFCKFLVKCLLYRYSWQSCDGEVGFGELNEFGYRSSL